jgi:hypothetical protein
MQQLHLPLHLGGSGSKLWRRGNRLLQRPALRLQPLQLRLHRGQLLCSGRSLRAGRVSRLAGRGRGVLRRTGRRRRRGRLPLARLQCLLHGSAPLLLRSQCCLESLL